MYRPFQIFSIISTLVALSVILGIKYQVRIFTSGMFEGIATIHFMLTSFAFFVLLLKDKKIIFAKNYALKNTLLYILTTPIPLILAFVLPYYSREFRNSLHLHRNVSDFNLCENCIKEGEPIEVIYRSGGPSTNNDFKFYYHCVGIAGSTGDTLNILTTSRVYITPSDNKRYFSTTMLKLIENLQAIDSNTNMSALKLRDIDKVVIDKDDAISENYTRYKTVIGELVTTTDAN